MPSFIVKRRASSLSISAKVVGSTPAMSGEALLRRPWQRGAGRGASILALRRAESVRLWPPNAEARVGLRAGEVTAVLLLVQVEEEDDASLDRALRWRRMVSCSSCRRRYRRRVSSRLCWGSAALLRCSMAADDPKPGKGSAANDMAKGVDFVDLWEGRIGFVHEGCSGLFGIKARMLIV